MRLLIIVAATIAAILGSPLTASSQHYYVVIGAFAAEEHASEFKGYLPGLSKDTSYTIGDQKNLLHYYVLKTSGKESAIEKTLHLRKEIESLNSRGPAGGAAGLEGRVSGNVLTEALSVNTGAMNASPTASAASSGGTANAADLPPRPVGKYFKFKIESPEGSPLSAQVHHVDLEKGRELAAYKANTFVDLLQPRQREPMDVVCGIFGYKEIHKYIDYSDPSLSDEEAYVDAQGAWVIPYKLERLEKGDVSIMYNMSFYKDAAIMRKASQTDLDELVKMMHSNPYYEITIHAHCNGKNKREIIALGTDKNYFDVAGSAKVAGTAKDLTVLRAEAIRNYLVDHGVDARRTKIFPWGGSDMLVGTQGPHANLNDRIEIEVTRD
ncbi:MAG: OmpA family protein [Cyclobacteriaceae bacterium]